MPTTPIPMSEKNCNEYVINLAIVVVVVMVIAYILYKISKQDNDYTRIYENNEVKSELSNCYLQPEKNRMPCGKALETYYEHNYRKLSNYRLIESDKKNWCLVKFNLYNMGESSFCCLLYDTITRQFTLYIISQASNGRIKGMELACSDCVELRPEGNRLIIYKKNGEKQLVFKGNDQRLKVRPF